MNDKQLSAFVKKQEKKSKMQYEKKQSELARIPDCSSCVTGLNNPLSCEFCIKDLKSLECKFVAQSKDFKRLVTYAMLGAMLREGIE